MTEALPKFKILRSRAKRVLDWIVPPGAMELFCAVRVRNDEEILQIDIVRALRAKAIREKWPIMWMAVPNQLEISGKSAMALYHKYRMMGKVRGASDLVIGCGGRMLCLEIKTDAGRLSPEQEDFREWCARCEVSHAVVRSVKEALDTVGDFIPNRNADQETEKTHDTRQNSVGG